jgi:excisionase family DNA binding protein
LTVTEAAKLCRTSKPTIYRLIAAGELPALRIGVDGHGPLRVPADELRAWLATRRTDR